MPSHTFATTDAEPLSSTDDTPYVAVFLVIEPTNAASCEFGTTPPTSNAEGDGDITLSPAGLANFWIAIPGQPVKLTNLYAAGAIGDSIRILPFRATAIMQGV